MSGETDLAALLQTMSPNLVDGLFVFATVSATEMPKGLNPRMAFHEAEGLTLILQREEAESHGLAFEYPCRMITLNVHSALEAVGFLARITTALAKLDMGVNPVSGFFHDHLFVPDGREQDAMAVLRTLAETSK